MYDDFVLLVVSSDLRKKEKMLISFLIVCASVCS